MKVLVIDDNIDVAKATSITLQALGCDVETEDHPEKVIDEVDTLQPDLLIMDIGMPEINGYELCRMLREHGETETMIVAHTGWGNISDKERAFKAGFDDILIKPVSLEQYQGVIDATKNKLAATHTGIG